MKQKPAPLLALLSSPRDYLDKARRDLKALDTALCAHDDVATRDAMVNASIFAFHVKDAIIAMHPALRDAAEHHARQSAWIAMCRDVCNASKHVHLRLDRRPYDISPPVIDDVDYTIGASAGVYVGMTVLKVFSATHGDHYADVVIENAIGDWQSFLTDHGIG